MNGARRIVPNLLEEIERRDGVTPKLVAFRLAGEPVTYAQLADRVMSYTTVTAEQQLVDEVAVYAALMSLIPETARPTAPLEVAGLVADLVGWLSRGLDIDDPDSGRRSLPEVI